jgi:hypothetical protein
MSDEINDIIEQLPDDPPEVPDDAPTPDDPKQTTPQTPPAATPPADPWHGKSREEVIQAYTQKEKELADLKAKSNAATTPSEKKQVKKDMQDMNSEMDLGLSQEQIDAMTPYEFFQHIKKEISSTLKATDERKRIISTTLADARTKFPKLDTDSNYRKLVKRIVYAGIAEKKEITLLQACEEANEILNIKPGEEKALAPKPGSPPISNKPPINTEAEAGSGAPSGGQDTDAEQASVHNALRPRRITPLGGLGF